MSTYPILDADITGEIDGHLEPKAPWWESRLSGQAFTITRFNIVAIQLVTSLSAIPFWAVHQAGEHAWNTHWYLDKHPKATLPLFIAFSILTPSWMLCVFLDVYRKGTIVSRVVFELLIALGLGILNCYLIYAAGRDGRVYKNGIYTVVYDVIQITGFFCSFVACTGWAGTLFFAAAYNHLRLGHRKVWLSGVRDFTWYDHPIPAVPLESDGRQSTFKRLTIGQSRGLGIYDGFYRPLTRFLSNHTVFRRVVGVEPLWLSLVRGTLGLSFLVGLLAYLGIQAVKLPLGEQNNALPVRPREVFLWAPVPPIVPLEAITIAFTIYPMNGYYTLGDTDQEALPVQPDTRIFYPDGTNRTCNISLSDSNHLAGQGNPLMWLWNCSRPGGLPNAFGSNEQIRGNHTWLDALQTYITVTMDWTPFLQSNGNASLTENIALVGLDSVDQNAFRPTQYESVLEFQNPSYTKMHINQHLKAQVETYTVLGRPRGFLDVLGVASPTQLRTYHPLTSIEPLDFTTPQSVSNTSSVTFYPGYGLNGQHNLEEYREYTVLGGLGATGGLYAILDLIFGILFGRPLMAIVFGSKYISPFGVFVALFGAPAMRRKVKRRYPNLDSHDHVARAVAMSDFMYDFVLDFGPGIARPGMFTGGLRSPQDLRMEHGPEETRHRNIRLVNEEQEEEKSPMVPESSGSLVRSGAHLRIRGEEFGEAREFDPADLEHGRV